MHAMDKINIADRFAKISEYWKPYIAAELNGQQVKLDKLKGEFVFHHPSRKGRRDVLGGERAFPHGVSRAA
jgi:hypothetical protein